MLFFGAVYIISVSDGVVVMLCFLFLVDLTACFLLRFALCEAIMLI